MAELAKLLRELAAQSATTAAVLRSMAEAFDPPPAELEAPPAKIDPAGSAACGCTLYRRCEAHEKIRRKGCLCNGPFYSMSCADLTHQSHAAEWPQLDPSLVG